MQRARGWRKAGNLDVKKKVQMDYGRSVQFEKELSHEKW